MTTGVRFGERKRAYEELRARAARIATGLADLGVGSGDRVAVMLRNEPAFLEVTEAAQLLGALPVPVNWHWRGEELAHLFGDSGAKVVFAHTDLVPKVEEVLPEDVGLVEVRVPDEVTAAYGLPPNGVTRRHPTLEALIESNEPWREPAAQAPPSVIYTSGTTGRPKGVRRKPHSPEDTVKMAMGILEVFGLSPEMRTLVPAPLYHSAPNVHALLASRLGIDLTIMPKFDPEGLLRTIERNRIEHIQMVPTMFIRLLRLPEKVRKSYDLSSLKAVVHAAAPCPVDVKQAMIDWWGPILREYYGGTETGIITASDSQQWLAHPGTVGRAVWDCDVKILDSEGRELPAGQVGEVYLKPPSFWPDFTYIGDDAKRRGIERDGYLTVGDMGYLTEDGYLFLCDRAGDMVISGGVNIYPAEIEAHLLKLEGVQDAAVFGIPDAEMGEALAAHIVADPAAGLTAERVREHVRAGMAGYKVPKVVVFEQSLPREETGKLFKRKLRDPYWAGAGRRI
ncbi:MULTISPECIES: AMP-binding protein [Thermomonospora]|uniref:AMP-dependent synthetase and ligase n=1 Tax=Thermomonospora curvata (strain ATCC 19995 / DSM 43183 / JCM 3096 / KCTC 9072 / NBRC 15933 / NCIMB 10081 / Henssen B9) TaxID=471852 RepID=D1AD60_THECD|nr:MULTISPECIES: AMP-binding protein [Thermomonospora]ACY99369.1 AMP-dependent synthetase and ligase [Thermomonospora curvata DSM 43183]PKK12419.1 MAG: long-chain fatty acid--CoA ligase [Thermomonospora sp. CIF 1]